MANNVVLGSALRTNLLSLQRTQDGIDKVQNILATGLKVSSALDNPQNFFAAKSLNDRASDLTRLLDGIGQSISTIQSADKGVTAVTSLVDQAESIISAAEEAISGGSSEAVLTGNVDLRNQTDVTDLNGVANGNDIIISYIDTDGTTERNETINISTNDSIDELIAKINDVGTSASGYEEGDVVEASLTENGFLQIKSKTGNAFNVHFDTDPADSTFLAADRALGTALGFGDIAQQTFLGGPSASEGNFEVTALATTKLTSGVFYDGTSGFADASDTLVTVRDAADGGGTVRFDDGDVASAGDATNIRFTINGSTNIDVELNASTTIQGLVDGINNSTSNDSQLKASYDSTTGTFSVESTSTDVNTVTVSVNNGAGESAATEVDFDFGIETSFATGAAASLGNGETFVLANPAGELARLESDYNTVLAQLDDLVGDAGYRGVNLLNGDDLVTTFNEDRSSTLTTSGTDLSSNGLGLSSANFTSSNLASFTSEILSAKDTVRSFGSAIANSLTIVQTRQTFTEDIVEELEAGAEKLTVADQNEEGAKLLALQTRQQLGVTSLSLAVQSQQSVLRLF